MPTGTPRETHPNRDAFPAGISSPALRALARAGVRSQDDLTTWTAADLALLHGMGPKALRLLQEALQQDGKDFRSA